MVSRFMPPLAVGALAVYSYNALGPRPAKAAFVFVVVPPALWLLIAIALGAAALRSKAPR